jgi:Domain of unknown function (DUF4349)
MKVIPFPKPGDEQDEQTLAAQIEASLHGESGGEVADHWRELRADVRSLTPPISPEFERELRERLKERVADLPRGAAKRVRARSGLAHAQAWLGSGLRPRLIALGGICAMAAVITFAIAAPWQGSNEQVADHVFQHAVAAPRSSSESVRSGAGASADHLGPSIRSVETSAAAAPSSSGSPSARVQQRAASITLAPKPAEVQSVADRIAQLAARDGGFVQSSQVRLQHGSGGEANLQLSLPSARLSAALAELARLAPTRAQSQSLQDITGEYGAARTRLSDAVAARQALLRALAKATTQGEIESLHARLSLASAAITRARTAFAAVARRGNNSTVEVSVLGDARAGSDRTTLSKALHNAGDVLKVALAVLIVALAVLVPLALLGVLVAVCWRASRRRLRERALS